MSDAYGLFDETEDFSFSNDLYEKWLTALRDGSYKQTQLALKTTQGFCCLGVLVDVAGGGKWVDHGVGSDVFDYKYPRRARVYCINDNVTRVVVSSEIDTTDAPSYLLQRATNGAVDADKLIGMNDAGYKFTEIADYIEQKVKG